MTEKLNVFIDTNTLLSGLIFPRGNEYKILRLVYQRKIELMLSEYVIEEARRIFDKKFQASRIKLKKFLTVVPYKSIRIPAKEEIDKHKGSIRDEKDLPILVSAIYAQPDYFISGDRDFLECEYKEKLNIMKSKAFLDINKGLL